MSTRRPETDTPRVRHCPVGPACAPITGWGSFLEHIYERHTSGTEAERVEQVQRHLEPKPVEPPARPAVVVPKVTADERTHALWALLREDRTKAREIIGSMGTTERRAFLAQLTELINMLWGELG
jgi:hypothetical protein